MRQKLVVFFLALMVLGAWCVGEVRQRWAAPLQITEQGFTLVVEPGDSLRKALDTLHNAALNRVFDEAELHGWLVKSLRPTLLNKGTKSESRGSFTDAEYTKIYGMPPLKWSTNWDMIIPF